jgi:predicted  nucleic acid-binding Zn-ribbon protein
MIKSWTGLNKERGYLLLEQLSFLVELQKLETENNRINIKKKELPNLISGLEKALKEFTVRMEEESKKLDELHMEHRNNEEKLKRGNEILKKAK